MRLGQIVGGLGESHGATDYPRVAHLYRQIFCPRIGRLDMSDYKVGLIYVDALPNCGECKVEVCEFVGYELGKVPALYCGACSTAEGVRLISELIMESGE